MKGIVTIGAHGYGERNFLDALQRAGVEVFCDIRLRRAMRGSVYAFANSSRLQARLAERGIRYVHLRSLAPSRALRAKQDAWDKLRRIAKRQRVKLSREFMDGYRRECLREFDTHQFVKQLGEEVRVAALFCVEKQPAACHRLLLAERLGRDLGIEPVHLVPET